MSHNGKSVLIALIFEMHNQIPFSNHQLALKLSDKFNLHYQFYGPLKKNSMWGCTYMTKPKQSGCKQGKERSTLKMIKLF